MGKRIPGIIAVILIIILLAGWYFFTRESKYFNTSAFKAVPVNSPIIIRIHNLASFSEEVSEDSVLNKYSGLPGFTDLHKRIHFADSLINHNPDAKKVFAGKDLTIAAGEGGSKSNLLYLLELSSVAEKKGCSWLISDFFTQKKASSVKQNSGNGSYTIYFWSYGPSMTTFAVSFYKGICLASEDTSVVSKAIRQLDLPSLTEDQEFQKVYKTASPNSILNIYLNHKTLLKYISPIFSESFFKHLRNSHENESWTEIDLTHKPDEIFLNGFTFAKDSLNSLSSVLLHQKPGKFTLAKYIPEETSFFLCLNLGDPALYLKDYEEFLKKEGSLNIYQQSLKSIDSTYSIDLQRIVAEHLDGETGIVFTRPDQDIPMENRFFLMKAKSGSQIEAAMQNLVKQPVKSKKGKPKDPALIFNIDQATSIKIYPSQVENFAEIAFGKIFADIRTDFFTIYDDCLIMGASYESLCDFLRSDLLGETLQNNKNFNDFVSGLSQRSNLFLWTAPGRSIPFFQGVFKEGIYKELERQIESLKKIESMGFQEGGENGLIYNIARIKYNPVVWDKPKTLWRSLLDNPVILKPQFVINQNDRSVREIVVQDRGNKLYLISQEGRTLWKIKLPGPIISEVFQINYFKNKKLQYLFNTKDAIYLIDHEGNNIENYPIKLKAKATNGISVFDYENNLDYRILVACSDHKVHAYDKKGKIVTGWSPAKTEHDVTTPVQYFRIKGKDYIVYFDKEKTYILDRQGKIRVRPKEEFTHSGNSFTLEPSSGKSVPRIVTTNNEGTVCFLGFDGKVNKFSPGKFSEQHYFLYNDLNNDNHPDFIYLDGDSLSVFDYNGKPVFSKKFKAPIKLAPGVYTFPGNNKKIGIVIPDENRIYLYNNDGGIYEGFPIEGNSEFNIGFINNNSRRLNLIGSTSDGFLNNYLVK